MKNAGERGKELKKEAKGLLDLNTLLFSGALTNQVPAFEIFPGY